MDCHPYNIYICQYQQKPTSANQHYLGSLLSARGKCRRSTIWALCIHSRRIPLIKSWDDPVGFTCHFLHAFFSSVLSSRSSAMLSTWFEEWRRQHTHIYICISMFSLVCIWASRRVVSVFLLRLLHPSDIDPPSWRLVAQYQIGSGHCTRSLFRRWTCACSQLPLQSTAGRTSSPAPTIPMSCINSCTNPTGCTLILQGLLNIATNVGVKGRVPYEPEMACRSSSAITDTFLGNARGNICMPCMCKQRRGCLRNV